MYIPNLFKEQDTEKLVCFMRENSFATVVSVLAGQPVASHLPLTVHQEGEQIVLRGHFAKANQQWQALEASETLAVFSGAHAYISPVHYDRYESVPTWNYLSVHAYGSARIVEDEAAVEELLAQLITQHEPSYQDRWESLSERYRDGMRKGIVGFELRVTRLEGQAKLSQNKTRAEQERIASALVESDDAAARATGAEMQKRLATTEE